jgi:hypothetical protein
VKIKIAKSMEIVSFRIISLDFPDYFTRLFSGYFKWAIFPDCNQGK